MRGTIFYYSNTGHTELACRAIAAGIPKVEFDLIDIMKDNSVEVDRAAIIGLAVPTFYLGIPEIFRRFLSSLPVQNGKPVFLINTFGMMAGQTLWLMAELAKDKGLVVIAGYSLAMPENYPPYITKGWTATNQPTQQQQDFLAFVAHLAQLLDELDQGLTVTGVKIKLDFFSKIIGVKNRKKIIKTIGTFKSNLQKCNMCGNCLASCSYGAIKLEPYPVFDIGKCWGCWSCFNHCPQKAIYSEKLKQVIPTTIRIPRR